MDEIKKENRRIKEALDSIRSRGYAVDTHQLLIGDASTRRFVRLYDNNGEAIILMIYPPNSQQSISEFLDIQQLLDSVHVPVPKIIDWSLNDEWILVGDLGDTMLYDIPSDQRWGYYKQALRYILVMQSHLRQPMKSIAFKRAFDVDKLFFELNFFIEYTLLGYHKAQLDKGKLGEIRDECMSLAKALDLPYKVFCHRDYHSRNMIVKDGKLYLIDFQDARMGLPFYDLVSLICDSYVDVDTSTETNLYTSFLDNSKTPELRNLIQEHHALEILHLSSLQRCIKAAGTFGFQATERKNHFYLQFLPRTYRNIKTNLGRYQDRFPNLYDAFMRYCYPAVSGE